MKYKCKECGIPITLNNMHSPYKCRKCHNEYHRKYRIANREKVNRISLDSMRAIRWLNGSDNYSGELG